MLEGSGGWTGRGESGDNVFVWNSGVFGVMKATRSSQERWRVLGRGCSGDMTLESSDLNSLKRNGVQYGGGGWSGLKVKGRSGLRGRL